jgi:hypothetical protein
VTAQRKPKSFTTEETVNMAAAAPGSSTPSFKLVLVGDGGTGKVSLIAPCAFVLLALPCLHYFSNEPLSIGDTLHTKDYIFSDS